MRRELSTDSAYLLGGLTQRVATLESRVDKVQRLLDQLRAWGLRVAILVTLWSAAIGSHLSKEQSSDLLAALLKAALKL